MQIVKWGGRGLLAEDGGFGEGDSLWVLVTVHLKYHHLQQVTMTTLTTPPATP